MVSELAKQKGKLAAVTESGGPIDKNHQWWTQVPETIKPFDLAYLLVWRNPHKPSGHGAFDPYKGCPDAVIFISFYNSSETLFQKEITKKELYK